MKLTFIIVSVMLSASVCAQEKEVLLEEKLSLDDNNADDGAQYEQLAHRLLERVNLNDATRADLAVTGILTDDQITAILQYRSRHGRFFSVYELQAVDALNSEIIRELIPLVVVPARDELLDRSLFRRIKDESENYFMALCTVTSEEKKGFRPDENGGKPFVGSRPRLLTRLRSFRPGDFSFGITTEKDEGEQLKWRPRNKYYGFDHVSAHVQLMNKGKIRNAIIGDFQYQFGQGLVFGGGPAFGKGAETITALRRAGTGIAPYTSAYESGNLRGSAATISLRKALELTLLFSSVTRDGSVRDAEGPGEPTVSSIPATGLHRTSTELEKRKTIRENVSGGALTFRRNTLSTGIAFQHLRYSAHLEPRPQLYNQFAFRGMVNNNASAFLNMNFHNIAFFSEFATSISAGKAYVVGVLASLGPKLEMSLLHRNYERNFYPFYGGGFSESSITQNERGVYLGFRYRWNRRFSLAGYADLFEFPWLKFRTYSPSTGSETFLRFAWQPSKTTLVYVQARREVKARNIEAEANTYRTGKIDKANIWVNLDYSVHPALRMKTRLQTSHFQANGQGTSGFLIFHDVAITCGRFRISGRYGLFDTDDFDNRLYAYESDVWMAYSLPSYYGKGTRQYIVVRYNASRQLSFWMRFAHTRYFDRETIGSGLNTIDGNTTNEFKFEARIRF